jgi:hypothetical protein
MYWYRLQIKWDYKEKWRRLPLIDRVCTVARAKQLQREQPVDKWLCHGLISAPYLFPQARKSCVPAGNRGRMSLCKTIPSISVRRMPLAASVRHRFLLEGTSRWKRSTRRGRFPLSRYEYDLGVSPDAIDMTFVRYSDNILKHTELCPQWPSMKWQIY